MGANTKIEWTWVRVERASSALTIEQFQLALDMGAAYSAADDVMTIPGFTFNPWFGCSRVSPGCEHCYAEGWAKRSGMVHWGEFAERRRSRPVNWTNVRKWNDLAGKLGIRLRVFCASLADWLDVRAPNALRSDLLNLIDETQNLDWLLLSKRIGGWNARMHECLGGSELARRWLNGDAPRNVWLGTTVEDQQRADERIPELVSIPARVRFLSCEPLLGPLDIEEHLDDQIDGGYVLGSAPIHWVICGGESGPKARPMHPEWARSLRDQCQAAGVPFMFKQWGEWGDAETCVGGDWKVSTWSDGAMSARVGKSEAGKLLDGREWIDCPKGVA